MSLPPECRSKSLCIDKSYVQGDPVGNVDFWEMRVSLIMRKNKERMRICLIVSGYWDRTVWIYKYESIVNGNEERENTVSCVLS